MHYILRELLNHSYKKNYVMIQRSQVEMKLINIDRAKEFLQRIPFARVKTFR